MSNQWYAQIMGEVVGPMSGGQLKQMAAQNRISPDDQVRKGESGNWASAGRVKGLFGATIEKPKEIAPLSPQIAVEVAERNLNKKPSRLTSCPDCDHQVSLQAATCPNCGRPTALETKKTPKTPAPSPTTDKRSKLATIIQYTFGFVVGIQVMMPSVWKADFFQPLIALVLALGLIPYTWDKFYAWSGMSSARPKRTRFLTVFAAMMVVSTIGGVVQLSDTNSSRNSTSTQSSSIPRDKQILYIDYATDLIETKLKSPSSASFPSVLFNLSAYTVKSNGAGNYTVTGYVDAQNSFGAKVRTNWVANLTDQNGHISFGDAHLLE